jgi:hypothetical protein
MLGPKLRLALGLRRQPSLLPLPPSFRVHQVCLDLRGAHAHLVVPRRGWEWQQLHRSSACLVAVVRVIFCRHLLAHRVRLVERSA